MSLKNQSQSHYPSQKPVKRSKRFNNNTIDFCKVGGLSGHLKTLREVIIFPLLHGNVFSHFNIKAPRGVLFYGPPGTGKTLLAAALATEINKEGVGKVSFFQRKGADVLDKWVGGSEKNLRDLFEKAAKCRPSIIFFDELDGLAPVREKQTDQIHASVVTTLLALMDGLDNKPGVVVIGATNRIEAVDSALRRPGRFDKELYFPLPGAEARKEILEVHTASWKHKLKPKLVSTLVDATSGFSGADLQALCSETILRCIKRVYPCLSGKKIDPEKLKIEECDFLSARLTIVPSTIKCGNKMRKLSPIVRPLLDAQLKKIVRSIQTFWPHFLNEGYKYVAGEERYAGRILLIGDNIQGLNTHLIPAILHQLEYLPVFVYDITKVLQKNPALFAHQNFPSVVLLSRVDEWWNLIDESEQLHILSSLEEIHAGLPVMVIATCKTDVPFMLQDYFYSNSSIFLKMENPNADERLEFLQPLFLDNRTVSVLSALENSRMYQNTNGDGYPVKKEILTTRSGKRIERTFGNNSPRGKRKRNFSNHLRAAKRFKLGGLKNNIHRSKSISSIYDIHKNIKREGGIEIRKCDSLSSIIQIDNKECFSKVLSNLLSQRNAKCSSENLQQLKAFLCEKSGNNVDDSNSAPNASEQSSNDAQMQQIYYLWKHASLVTSKNMAVAQLELLYDVISACINIHWQSFESLVKNLEGIFNNIEQSYNIKD